VFGSTILSGAARQLLDDAVLVGAELVDIDLRRAEADAPVGGMVRLVDHLGDVQQGLRRDAPLVQAHAAGVLLLPDQRDLHPEVGGIERRGISPGAGTKNCYVCGHVGPVQSRGQHDGHEADEGGDFGPSGAS
jgi:hypothetical protein